MFYLNIPDRGESVGALHIPLEVWRGAEGRGSSWRIIFFILFVMLRPQERIELCDKTLMRLLKYRREFCLSSVESMRKTDWRERVCILPEQTFPLDFSVTTVSQKCSGFFLLISVRWQGGSALWPLLLIIWTTHQELHYLQTQLSLHSALLHCIKSSSYWYYTDWWDQESLSLDIFFLHWPEVQPDWISWLVF